MHFVTKSTLNYLSSKYTVHIFVNIVVFSALAFILPIRFETNDDLGMLAIASGNYLSVPDAHLVFINYIYGLLVSSLYKVSGEIEWYTLLFAIIHIVSWSIISWRIFLGKTNLGAKLIALLLFLSLEICCILYFQFTTTAAICATGSIVLFISFQNDKLRALAILLFLIGSLIRFDAACLVLLLTTPLFLKELYDTNKRVLPKYIINCLLLVILPFTAKFIDEKIYDSNDDWKYYKEYNRCRGSLNDNPNAYSLTDFPQGITDADYTLLLRFFSDCSVMTLDKIKEISSRVDSVKISVKMNNLMYNTTKYRSQIILVFLACFTLFLLQRNNIDRFIVALIPILFTFAMIFVSLNATFKQRVFISMLIPICWVSYSMFCTVKQKHKWFYILPLCVSLLLTISICRKYILSEIKNNEDKELFVESQTLEIIDYLRTLEREYVIHYHGGLMLHYFSPFKTSEYMKYYKAVHSGWYANIPFNKGIFDSYKDIIDKNYVLIIQSKKDQLIEPIKESVKLHYGISVEPKIVYESDLYCLIRFVSVCN